MLYGAVNAFQKNNPSFWYEQTGNTVEQVNKKLIAEIIADLKKKYPDIIYKRGNLETCGASSAANCLAAIGKMGPAELVKYPGGYKPQLDSLIADYANNRNNYPKLRQCGFDPESVQGTRVFAAYPLMIKEIFDSVTNLVIGHTWQRTIDYLKQQRAIQMCFKDPGHYFAVIEADDLKMLAQVRDHAVPFPGRITQTRD